MAGQGRRASRSGNTVLRADGVERGFDLPDGPTVLPKNGEWKPLSVRKWAIWRKCPMATRWDETDWYFALDTLILYNGALESGRWELFAEVRQREAKLGITYADRQSMKFEVPEANDYAVHDANAAAARNDFDEFRRRRRGIG